MEWSREQVEVLYRNVYGNDMTCPACGGALTRAPSPDADAFGVVTCHACDQKFHVSVRNDPLRGRFRDFSEQEKKELAAADRVRRTPRCPVDATAMSVDVQRSLGRTSNVTMRCPRCTRSVAFARLHG